MEKWRLIDDRGRDGFTNMALDEAILLRVEEEKVPTLRFYLWKPPAISIGHSQKVEEEVRLKFCKEKGIDIVRRISGGGAIFHNDELTYSFISPLNSSPAFSGILESYLALISGIKEGFRLLGIETEVRGGKSSRIERNVPCFALESRHDLVFKNKKVLGSAQRRRKRTFLQHGSIPLSFDYQLSDKIFFNGDSLRERTISISDILGFRPSFEEVKGKIISGLSDKFGVKFEKGAFSSAEIKLAKEIRKDKVKLI